MTITKKAARVSRVTHATQEAVVKKAKTTTVKRSIGADTTPVAGNLLSVQTPAYVSLVGRPANQRPFTVIRNDDNNTEGAAKRDIKRVSRTRRSDNSILVVNFPAAYDEGAAKTTIETFGLVDYTLSHNGTNYLATRSDIDLQSIAKDAASVRVTSDGVTVTLDPNAYTEKAPTPSPSVALVRLEFNKKTFDETQVNDWLAKNSIDSGQVAVENSGDELISVQRKEVDDKTEVRRMEIEPGVIAVVSRSDVLDVPDSLAVGVVEAAYGGWGWGQMDFSAAYADEAFCDAYYDAKEALDSVLRNILYYSGLPLDTRKTLVTNATTQFAAFINNAIDALPRQVLLLATRSDAEPKQENQAMTTEAQRAEAEAKAQQATADAATAAAAQATADAQPVTRGDIAGIIAQTLIAAGLTTAPAAAAADAPAAAAATGTEVARTDATATETAPAAAAATPAVAAGAATETISRADFAATLAAVVAPLAARLERAESVTIVRSEQGDPAQVNKEGKKQESVFRGSIFGNLKEKK